MGDKELTRLRRDHIGFVFQAFNLLPMLTAEENILLPLAIAGRKPEAEWVETVIERVGLDRPPRPPPERALRRPAAARRRRPRPRRRADGAVRRRADRQPRLEDRRRRPRRSCARPSTTTARRTVMVTHDARAAATADRVLFLADGVIVSDLDGPDRGRGPRGHEGGDPMIRIALRGLASRPLRTALTAHRHRARRRHGQRRVHRHRHHAQRRRTRCPPPPTTGPTPSSPPPRASRTSETIGGNRTIPASTVDRVRRHAGRRRSPSATSSTRPRSSARTARRSARARTSASATTPRTPGADERQPVPAEDRPLGHRRPARSSSTAAPPSPRTSRSATRSRSSPTAPRGRTGSSAPRRSVTSRRSAPPPPRCSTCASRRSCSRSRAASTTCSSRRSDGAAPAALRRTLSGQLGTDLQVQTARAQDRFTLDGLKEFVSFIRVFLLAFGGIAVLVGAFTIFNSLSITVAQRSRELALLRTMGASRRQVMGTVMFESLLVGVLASAIGLAAGLGLAKGLNAAVRLARPRPAAHRHGVRHAHDRGGPARRHPVDARRRPGPRAAGDPRRAGGRHARRRGERGRQGAHEQGRHRLRRPRPGRPELRHVRQRPVRDEPPRVARPGLHRPVRRRRPAVPALRRAAGLGHRPPGRADRQSRPACWPAATPCATRGAPPRPRRR